MLSGIAKHDSPIDRKSKACQYSGVIFYRIDNL